ncbi:MAG: serine/threonine-protein kinase, partial [Pseudomonadota bacterium]
MSVLADKVQPLPIGHLIGGGHRIVTVLGQGGFGITYKAVNNQGHVVAIKEFCPRACATRVGDGLSASPRDREEFDSGYRYFRDEAETLRKLPPHPNIVAVHALFRKNGTIYMVMDFIDGEPLNTELVSNAPYSDGAVLDLLGQLTMALGLLHEHQVLHCDIKPQNIMIDRSDGRPVLIDFGATRDLRRRGAPVEILTEGYAPIEMHEREIGRLGPWSDFYSLGVVGYILCTGKKPPSAKIRAETIRSGRPDPLALCTAERRPGIS